MIKKKMTIQELNKYYEELNEYFKKGELHAVPNSDSAHDSTIMRFMLDKSESLSIYCGEMSVFRNLFYKEIEDHQMLNEESTMDLKEQIQISLRKFLSRSNSRINLIVKTFKKTFIDDVIETKIFKNGIKNGQIKIFEIKDKRVAVDAVPHFSFTEKKIVRMEQNMEQRSGLCAVNIPDTLKTTLENNFKILLSVSKLVDCDFE